MVNERYPVDTTIDKSDFDKNSCQRILDELSNDEYGFMHFAFSKAALKAINEGNPKQAKIYYLLSDACSMILSHESKNEPFKPFMHYYGCWRSVIADDFSAEDISFFSK